MHWGKRRKIAHDGHLLVAQMVRNLKPIREPVVLLFRPELAKGKRKLDVTNYQISVKVFEDGLVQCGFLQADTSEHVKFVGTVAPIRAEETGMRIFVTSARGNFMSRCKSWVEETLSDETA